MKDVVSDSFVASYNRYGLFAEDRLTVALSQPHRVQSGSMGLRIAGLAGADGSIPYVNKLVDLKPSGRQLDLAVGYAFDVGWDTTLSTKFLHTKDANHVKGVKGENSILLGFKHKNIYFGSLYNDTKNDLQAKVKYSVNF